MWRQTATTPCAFDDLYISTGATVLADLITQTDNYRYLRAIARAVHVGFVVYIECWDKLLPDCF